MDTSMLNCQFTPLEVILLQNEGYGPFL